MQRTPRSLADAREELIQIQERLRADALMVRFRLGKSAGLRSTLPPS